ncbi:DNA-binding transcriptional regulator, GntR family [Polaromonas sp. OV174]|uniref:GntR family transcriptional regulator n=1 Tax=Polaromonas sp. OV174 TaxID=1855300 RepID=UPI0008F1C294|nr:GntR family transcriptional regulator [Polaromonas sp. OV174]SFC10122.1 DNA-binding transcriptional regulator, GntR family [Polaromonas sp. OV174]
MSHDDTTIDAPMERDLAYDRVRQSILSRQLAAGSAVSERGLSEALGLGRTPVREAIKTLAQEGFLEIVPMRGTFVRQLTLQDLREIHEVRLGLEGIASVLAAQRGPSEELRQCAQQLWAMQASTVPLNTDAAQKLGWHFHEAIFRAAGNQRLLALYRNLRAQSGLALQHNEHYDRLRVPEAIGEHLHIYAAIEAQDADAAQRRTWDHLTGALQTKLRLLTAP